jgi:TRAP-type transport system small permease protein
MLRMEAALRSLTAYIAVGGLSLLLLLAVCTLLDGLLRALAGYPLDIVREIGDLVAAVAGASCLPIVMFEQGNIVLRMLDNVLSRRIVKMLDLFNAVVIFFVLVGIAGEFWIFAMKSMKAGEATWLLNVRKSPFWFAVDCLLWVTALVQLFHVAKATMSLKRSDA